MPKLKDSTQTLAELKLAAKNLKIKGRSKMKKKELKEAIESHKGVVEDDDMESFLNTSAAKVGLTKIKEKKKKTDKDDDMESFLKKAASKVDLGENKEKKSKRKPNLKIVKKLSN